MKSIYLIIGGSDRSESFVYDQLENTFFSNTKIYSLAPSYIEGKNITFPLYIDSFIRNSLIVMPDDTSGTDKATLKFAKDYNFPYKIFEGDWSRRPPEVAGPRRNKMMVEYVVAMLEMPSNSYSHAYAIIFKGGTVTQNCKEFIEKHKDYFNVISFENIGK